MYELENYIKYPDNCLVGEKIPKKTIYDAAELVSKDKNLFKNVDRIIWIYSLKKSNTNIDSYSNDELVYNEIEVIEVEMSRKVDDTERISQILQRFIPYPTLVVFHFNEQLQLSVAHQREHKADSEKITLTEHRMTDWIRLMNLDIFDEKLFDDLKLDNLSKINFYELYSDMVDSVTLYNSSKQVGRILTISASEAKEINNQIYEIDKEMRKLKAAIKKETQFNKQAEINMELHKLKVKKEDLRSQLV